MKTTMTKSIGIALAVVTMGIAVWAAPFAQADASDCLTGGDGLISGEDIAEVVVVEIPCTVENSILREGVQVVTGSLTMTDTVVFGEIVADPDTSVDVDGPTIFGVISTYLADAVSVSDSKVADGIEVKEGNGATVSGSTLGGIKFEKVTGNVSASNNLLGDKVEVKEVTGSVTLNGNTGGEVIVEKSGPGAVSITDNTAFSTIKVVGNTGTTTVTGNKTPKLECSGNTGLTDTGNITVEDICLN
jgi:hypothetical protein